MTTERFAQVAVRARMFKRPLATYTYQIPAVLAPFIEPGTLVWVPLRREQVQGVVITCDPQDMGRSETLPYAIRPIVDLGDPDVSVPPLYLRLARFVAHYYHVSLWDAIELLLPAGIGQEAQATWQATKSGDEIDLGVLPSGERDLLFYIRKHGQIGEADLHAAMRGSPTELRRLTLALAQRGLIDRGTALTSPQVRVQYRRTARLLLTPEHFAEAQESLRRAPRQQNVLATVIARTEVLAESDAVPAHDLDLSLLRKLATRGWIVLEQVEVLRNPLDNSIVERDMPPELTRQQATVLQPIITAIDREEHTAFLLHGVTGSGKTEIYLRAIARAMRKGHQTLVLVPEIALTAQLVQRFTARFGPTVAVLHSELSLGERYDTWRRLRRGEAQIVVGSRSVVFTPLPKLGLVVVDEEHDSSYKHVEGVRYQARDVALKLGELTGCTVVLGSATPAVESYQAARNGRLQLLELNERVTGRGAHGSQSIPLPPVRVVDMRIELQRGNRSIFSRALQDALAKTLAARQQGMLFLNRRGVASIILCRDCGYVVSCVRCSSPLVLHTIADLPAAADVGGGIETILRCHTCGYRELPPAQCPQCWSARIRHFGVGTQRVVEEVATLFPEARVIRWDRDVTGRKGSHERLLKSLMNHEADIVVGTQMIAKGLDLPLVTLVGIVSADIGLHLPDFRSGERTFQLLAQVAGRAGRRGLGGQVILQSYTPDHYALVAAANHDYARFFREEIAFRRDAHYPPFSRLVRFVYAATNPTRAQRMVEELAERVKEEIARLGIVDAGVIGPAPAFAERIRGRYRWHFIVRTPDIHRLLDEIGPLPGWTVDVDPVSML